MFLTPFECGPDTFVLPTCDPVPGHGHIMTNAFLIRGTQPTLIDTCGFMKREPFLDALWKLVEPKDLRWIFITHEESDHAGNLKPILEAAPNATLLAQFQAVGKLTHDWAVPFPRAFLLSPGQSHDIGDRKLRTVRPPLFDSTATSAVFDTKTETLFSSDCFGAFMPNVATSADELPEDKFYEGLRLFNRANHPWVSWVDKDKFAASLELIATLGAKTIASTHGPVAKNRAEKHLRALADLPSADPWMPPDQATLMELMKKAGGPPPKSS